MDSNPIPADNRPAAVPEKTLVWNPSEHLLNRETSWLQFNSRVLAQAEDPQIPLLERLKFIAIVGSNMDEFFMKRVGSLKLQTSLGLETPSPDGLAPVQQLSVCRPIIADIVSRQSKCFMQTLVPLLKEQGVCLSSWQALAKEQKKWCRAYFIENIYAVLTPLAVDASHPFPFISNLSLSSAVVLKPREGAPKRFVRIKVPRNRNRWVALPGGQTFVPLEEVIANCIDLVYPGETLSSVNFFRVTRSIVVDAADYEDDLYQDFDDEPGQLRREVVDELRERRFAPAVRLEADPQMPPEVCSWLLEQLHLTGDDLYQKAGPIGLADLFSFTIDRPDLKYRPWRPRTHPRFRTLPPMSQSIGEPNIFTEIRRGDILVHHPYHDFDTSVLRFIRAAADDPKVLAIKQTLYRTAADSPVVHALVRAAERDKQVAVLVELKARLDEYQNLRWAQVLESAGAHVTYGVEDLKTHTKLVLVVREEEQGLRRYAHIGTGNYHPGTARLYTDVGLMTANPAICDDVAHLFNALTGYSQHQNYKRLLVAPRAMRSGFIALIDREIEHASAGRKAHIFAKMNQLEDTRIIRKLYEASLAGVEIDLIVRGFCVLRPGVAGLSERIRVSSIVGRFLEHERVFRFHNSGAPEYYIGSADWMSRNLGHRVEAVVRVEDPACRADLDTLIDVCLRDNRLAWDMLPDGAYKQRHPPDGQAEVASQDVFMQMVSANDGRG